MRRSQKNHSSSEQASKPTAEQAGQEQIFNSLNHNEKQELENLKKEFAKFQLEQVSLQNKVMDQPNFTNDSQTNPNFPWMVVIPMDPMGAVTGLWNDYSVSLRQIEK